jgi:hypothetical protein
LAWFYELGRAQGLARIQERIQACIGHYLVYIPQK